MISLLFFGIIGVLAGVVLHYSAKREGKKNPTGMVVVWGSVVLIVLSVVAGSFTQIPAGHRGVVIRFGGVTGSILNEGLQVKLPFIDGVVKTNVQTQKYEAGATSLSLDLQDVNTTIALNYKLEPSAVAEVYRTLGLEYMNKIAAPAIQETVKAITAKYNAEDLILRRSEAKAGITSDLSARLQERGIITEAVSITNFQFSETFTAAIEAKVAAEQAVLESRNKLERVKVEAQQAQEKARGEANAAIAQAEGQAKSIQIVTEAQVSANQDIAESLNDDVLRYIFIDRLGEDIKVIVVPSGQGLDFVLPDSALPETTP
jgi:regulator of protease activity HflC (stomatin/prohibitin superfamily)